MWQINQNELIQISKYLGKLAIHLNGCKWVHSLTDKHTIYHIRTSYDKFDHMYIKQVV